MISANLYDTLNHKIKVLKSMKENLSLTPPSNLNATENYTTIIQTLEFDIVSLKKKLNGARLDEGRWSNSSPHR